MEVENVATHLKYVNTSGFTLNIEERMQLDLALQKLQNDFAFEELLLWGKVLGTVKDYFVAVALTYTGQRDFPKKQFFWCSASNFIFAQLPDALKQHETAFNKMQTYFTGEFDRVLISGGSEGVKIDEGLVLPPKHVTELDRLAWTVR